MSRPQTTRPDVQVFILAGGLSARMGRDKGRLRLGGRPMAAIIRDVAARLGHPVRVLRKDAVPRCGPLGGVLTAFRKSKADHLLFLSCDMPFIGEPILRRLIRTGTTGRRRPVFFAEGEIVGFPFILPRSAVDQVEGAWSDRRLSLNTLAKTLGARRIKIAKKDSWRLLNVNTPGEFEAARKLHFQNEPRSNRRNQPVNG